MGIIGGHLRNLLNTTQISKKRKTLHRFSGICGAQGEMKFEAFGWLGWQMRIKWNVSKVLGAWKLHFVKSSVTQNTEGKAFRTSKPQRNEGNSICPILTLPLRTCMLSRFSRVWFCTTLWTAAHQAPLSMGFSRQENWSGLPCPPPGDPPNPGIYLTSPASPALQADSIPLVPPGKPHFTVTSWILLCVLMSHS